MTIKTYQSTRNLLLLPCVKDETEKHRSVSIMLFLILGTFFLAQPVLELCSGKVNSCPFLVNNIQFYNLSIYKMYSIPNFTVDIPNFYYY